MRRATIGMTFALLALTASPALAQQTQWIDGSPVQTRIRVGADGETFVGVWIQAPEQVEAVARTPMAVSLVVDISGSMAGAKIDNARMAAASLLESLSDGDIVSIYGFNNVVTEFAQPTVVGPGTRTGLMQRVSQLYAAGGTNLYGGMQAGIARMSQAPPTHAIRRVFLISDGHANVGPSDTASLANLAAGATEWGTQVTAIGVGVSYDQPTLSAMVVRSSGRLYHLSQPAQMAQILEQELSLLSRSVAVNAYIEVEPAPGVVFLDGSTTGAEVVNGRVRMPLGAVFAGQEREVLFRARVATDRVGNRPLGQARLVYRRPGETQTRTERAPLAYEVVRNASAARASRAPRVAAMVANHQASQAQFRAAEMMRGGQTTRAAAELDRARATLDRAARQAPPSSASGRRLRERATSVGRASQRAAHASPAAAPQMSYEFADDAAEAEGY